MCLCNEDLKQHLFKYYIHYQIFSVVWQFSVLDIYFNDSAKQIDQLSDWELVLVMNPANQQRGPEIIKYINNFDLFDAKLS